jgi:hypothetical protein
MGTFNIFVVFSQSAQTTAPFCWAGSGFFTLVFVLWTCRRQNCRNATTWRHPCVLAPCDEWYCMFCRNLEGSGYLPLRPLWPCVHWIQPGVEHLCSCWHRDEQLVQLVYCAVNYQRLPPCVAAPHSNMERVKPAHRWAETLNRPRLCRAWKWVVNKESRMEIIT